MATKLASVDLAISIHSAFKPCQVLATQGTSHGFKPNVRCRNINDNKCMCWKQVDNDLPKKFHQVTLLFKDERGLGEHPLSCHPQGVVELSSLEGNFGTKPQKEVKKWST